MWEGTFEGNREKNIIMRTVLDIMKCPHCCYLRASFLRVLSLFCCILLFSCWGHPFLSHIGITFPSETKSYSNFHYLGSASFSVGKMIPKEGEAQAPKLPGSQNDYMCSDSDLTDIPRPRLLGYVCSVGNLRVPMPRLPGCMCRCMCDLTEVPHPGSQAICAQIATPQRPTRH